MNRYLILFTLLILLAACQKALQVKPVHPKPADPIDKFIGSYSGLITYQLINSNPDSTRTVDTAAYTASFAVEKQGADSFSLKLDSNFVFENPKSFLDIQRPDSLTINYRKMWAMSGTNETLNAKITRDSLIVTKWLGTGGYTAYRVTRTFQFAGKRM